MVKGLKEYGLSKNQNVKVKRFSGCTTEYMFGIFKPVAWRKLDAIIIQAETNDITRDINTMKNIREIVNLMKACSKNTQVLLSVIIIREDWNYNGKFIFSIRNYTDGTCLNIERLYLNKNGYSKFSPKLIKSMKST